MAPDLKAAAEGDPYWKTYMGRFFGILDWGEADALLGALKSGTGAGAGDWYLFDTDRPCPETTASQPELAGALDDNLALLADFRDRTVCGTLYVDDRQDPSFIKMFDPYRMGSSCGGTGANTVIARWIVSRAKPSPLPPDGKDPARGAALWKRLIGWRTG